MNKSYKSLNPEKDFRQQIKSIFKACKVQQGQIATFPSPINIKNIKHLSTDDIGICHECNKKRPYKNWCEKCWNRCNYGVKVILKTFMNDDDFADFLHEPKAHLNCCIPNAHISSLYGFTQDPVTNQYLMVLEYSSDAHDIKLIMEICNGCRPDIVKETPNAYVSLMKRCWHSDPAKRPTAEELVYLIKELSTYTCFKKINLSEKESLKINLMNSLKNTHPLAIYSSKLLPTLFTDHDQYDNEDDDDQLSEYDDSVESSPLILLNNNNLL
ncbi:unnamed protein product [Rhizophagus irregularis]|nr:unnamed protein product [Rhizophagus irregularis]